MNSAADPLADPRLDRQLEKLDRLADLGLEIVQALAAQAKGEGPKVVEGDIALAYERVARGVRMAVMLQSRLAEDVRLGCHEAVAAHPGATDLATARKAAVVRVVERVAAADGRLDGFQIGWARGQARERLEHDDIYGSVMTRPVSELVAAICRDLGLTPDWARLAQEAWAQDEIDSGAPGEPLLDLVDTDADLDPAVAIPTLEDRIQAWARDPTVLAAAGADSS